jgi:hypothetical protein
MKKGRTTTTAEGRDQVARSRPLAGRPFADFLRSAPIPEGFGVARVPTDREPVDLA